MVTDLTKMVLQYQSCHDPSLYCILKAMAAEIEANKKEIEGLKTHSANPYLLSEEEIARLRQKK